MGNERHVALGRAKRCEHSCEHDHATTASEAPLTGTWDLKFATAPFLRDIAMFLKRWSAAKDTEWSKTSD